MYSTFSSLVGAWAYSCSFDYKGGFPALCLMGGRAHQGCWEIVLFCGCVSEAGRIVTKLHLVML